MILMSGKGDLYVIEQKRKETGHNRSDEGMEKAQSLLNLIREKAHMHTIMNAALDLAATEPSVQPNSEVLNLLKLAVSEAIVSHNWTDAEKAATRLLDVISA
jgi:hypothetical protein